MAEPSSLSLHTLLLPPFSHHPPRRLLSPSHLPLRRPRCSVASTPKASGPIPWGCEIDTLDNASALQKWLSDSGLPPQKMEIDRVEVGERGLVAVRNIRKGEKLLFVPPPLVITAESVRNSVLELDFELK